MTGTQGTREIRKKIKGSQGGRERKWRGLGSKVGPLAKGKSF